MIYEDMKDIRQLTSLISDGAILGKWKGKEREA